MEKLLAMFPARRRESRGTLIIFSVLIGVVAGLTAVLYRAVLSYMDGVRTFLYSMGGTVLGACGLFLVLAAAGYVVGRITESEPLIRGSGIPQMEGQLLGFFRPCWWRVLIKKFVGGAISLACGLSLGREGPSIQLGAMAADGVSKLGRQSELTKKYLLVCGGCAGLAAAFNAPLAGVLFALEEVHKHFSAKAVFPAMLSAITADVVSKLCFGTVPVLNLSMVHSLPPAYFLLYAAFGIISGVLGALYNKTLFATQDLYKKTGLPVWAQIMIPFMLAGILGYVCPDALGSGHEVILGLAASKYTVGAIALLLTVKFAFSMVCFCSGAPGGIFFPLLVLGSLAGELFGGGCIALLNLPEEYMLNFMLLGMAGLFASIVRAPLTGILLVVEMSGSLNQMLGVSVVACISALTANLIESPPVYEGLLARITPRGAERREECGAQSALDVFIASGSPLVGKMLTGVALPKNCVAVSVRRGTEQMVPNLLEAVCEGDVITFFCAEGDEALVRAAVEAKA